MYLDDVRIFFRTMEEHSRHLREVLLLLEKARVSLQPSKCHLLQQKVKYLGHVVRPGRLLVNQKSIKGMAQALPPRSQTEFKSSLGMCNVYQRYINDYAHIAKPLTKHNSKKLPRGLSPLDAAQMAAVK